LWDRITAGYDLTDFLIVDACCKVKFK